MTPEEKSLRRYWVNHYLSQNYLILLSIGTSGVETYWIATIPDLPGCMADGVTPNEAIDNIWEAKSLWIESVLEDGLEVPEPSREVVGLLTDLQQASIKDLASKARTHLKDACNCDLLYGFRCGYHGRPELLINKLEQRALGKQIEE